MLSCPQNFKPPNYPEAIHVRVVLVKVGHLYPEERELEEEVVLKSFAILELTLEPHYRLQFQKESF
jgi:hypothetical protein